MSIFKTPPENTKDSYQRDTETRLKKIKTRITTLERKVDETKADIKVRHDQKLSQIRGQYAQSKEKLNELMQSSQEDWQEFKTKLDSAINALEEAIDIVSNQVTTQSKD